MNRLLIRIVLPLLILAAGWRALQQFRAAQIARAPSTVNDLRQAVQLDPEGPDYHFRLGLAYRDLPELQDPVQAQAHLESAATLNPYSWRYQRELAQLYELSGDIDRAGQAFRQAVELSPSNGAYRWRLANFYLRHRTIDEAIPQLELAVGNDRQLLEPALELLLAAGGSYQQIDRVWPTDQEARRRLLRLISQRTQSPQKPPIAGTEDFLLELWRRLLADAEPLPIADGQVYIERLIQQRRFEEARARWVELTDKNGMPDRQFRLSHNLIWNGDFESSITQAGLGWVIHDDQGYTATLAADEGFDHSTSLRITFDGSQNMNLSRVQQRVVVEPGQSYRLSFRGRAQDLSTDQGVFFEVQDGPSRKILLATERFLGSMPWTTYASTFVSPNPWIHIQLRRVPSSRFDNRMSGVLWIDSVRLERST